MVPFMCGLKFEYFFEKMRQINRFLVFVFVSFIFSGFLFWYCR
jgi:hypothetical protein